MATLVSWHIGDQVRCDRFGEWLEGVITDVIENISGADMVEVTYRDGSRTFAYANSPRLIRWEG
ncbi:MAG: hypothetical protein KGL39_24465 [Patescibacteria group bacterium]|nr:hypothetical protein [Patescibacteria group bacterium]